MDVRKQFTQQLNYRYVNQLIDLSQFAAMAAGGHAPSDARVFVEGRGVQVLRITLPKLHNDAEKACIRVLRKAYPDAVYLFADDRADNDKTTYHLCNDAGKQLPLTPEKKLLFTDKVKFFEVTDNLTGTLELKERIAKAFETEKITKRFYNEFKSYREKLVKFIQGIPLAEKEDRNWYASVLLNRLMFIYFIQKRGFINGDENWLKSRLAEHEAAKKTFYTDFLMPLFFSGFDKRPGERGAQEAAFAGVPYLNGGLFQRHPLEDRYPDLSIDNKVLRELLDYFDRYRWYLDDRELRDENEINPDVLGFIFEKYVNQKQMGAYYTKEDITGYICRNTILPFLLTKLANAGDGQPASLPFPIDASNIERFIYDAVKTGAYLPTETEREYAARRKRFEGIKSDAVAGKIAAVNDLITYNLDIVTYADDAIARMDERALKRFYFEGLTELTVLDPTCGSGAFLFAALNILLPLYTVCLQCMRGFVQGKSKNDARETRAGLTNEYSAFKQELSRIAQHDNERYYIIKSIIVNNLYGVDIMEEATEICKLRLFLRLASEIKDTKQIEPLPDIDFNIKAGNTLVGFANRDDVARALSTQQRVKDGLVAAQGKLLSGDTLADDAVAEVERECADADREFKRYHELQTERNIAARELVQAKHDLRARMKALNNTLDRALAREYGVALPNEQAEASTKAGKKGKAPLNTLGESAFEKWKESHQPFHWFAEFYGILVERGGFDVIVGNPPWKEYAATKDEYATNGYITEKAGNLYALCIERSIRITSEKGCLSLIVQLPLVSSNRMEVTRKLMQKNSKDIYLVPCDDRPGKLFEGLQNCRSTIFLLQRTPESRAIKNNIHTTAYLRWASEVRKSLFETLFFTELPTPFVSAALFLKLFGSHHANLLVKMISASQSRISQSTCANESRNFIFYQEATRYWIKASIGYPFYSKNGKRGVQPHGRHLYFDSHENASAIFSVINSSLFYVYFVANSDCFHLSDTVITSFPLSNHVLQNSRLIQLGEQLMQELKRTAERKQIETKQGDVITYDEFSAAKCKTIIDEIDQRLAKHYGFTDEELDFIINYDIKYRMGRDAEAEDE